ncbi:hypothetical protein QAD02_010558 [Eretmocerus hayati]|uniref:Uncharacterized protein n=1 Tax=Eretmocerus hayati TaxID=131215 RepID=A0ACC2NX29_9HYME|nr:hypothetical protein QAD02_010558 [Eretmocerus hayati]
MARKYFAAMNFLYGVILATLLVISDQSTPYKKCSKGPPPLDLRVTNCTKGICPLRRGTNVTAEWDFTVDEDTTILRPRVRVSGSRSTTHFPQKDACSTLKNATCPLVAGQNVTYMLEMPILKSYPRMPLNIEFAFLDQNDTVVVCFKLAARVVNK